MQQKKTRSAGVLAPVTALRREGDLGIGDVGALRDLVVWAVRFKVGFLQLLPINETGGDHSPYNAISSVALEPTSIDLSAVPEISAEEIELARDGMAAEDLEGEVNYEAVKAIKRELLEKGYARFCAESEENGRATELTRFCEKEADWLPDYCIFRYLMDQEGGSESWDLWSMNYNTPEKARAWVDKKGGDKVLRYYAWVQWLAFSQWRSIKRDAEAQGVKLMGDIPIGVSFYGADVFFERQGFDLNWTGGAPPETVFKADPFTVKWGQNWGVPLFNWAEMAKDDYAWWRRRIEKLSDVFGIFRVDHILGFYRIYAFPWRPSRNDEFLPLNEEEARARTGGLLPSFLPFADDTEEHKAANLEAGDRYLKVLQQAAGASEVVGEDLGTVPDYVRPHLEKIGIAGFKIPHWEVEYDVHGVEHPIPGDEYHECSFATYATHDHPPIAAMWHEYRESLKSEEATTRIGAAWDLRILSEIAGLRVPNDRLTYSGYSTEIRRALIAALFKVNSRYAALMITDIYGMKERFNTPGTVGGKNWRVRMPFTVAEMMSDPRLVADAKEMADFVVGSGRA